MASDVRRDTDPRAPGVRVRRRLRVRWRWLALGLCCWAAALRLVWWQWLRPQTDPWWERIQRTGVVRIGMDATYPPFELQDATGQFVGYDVDLANELASRWGVQAQFVNVHFDGLYDALHAGKFDLIISALPYDPTLTEDVLYSPSYLNAGLVLVAPDTDTRITGPRDLAGKRVSVEMGAGGHLEARRLLEQVRIPLDIVPADTPEQALQALADGQTDACIVDAVSAHRFARAAGGVRICKNYLVDEQYVIAMPRHSGALWNRVTEELARMEKDGFLLALQQRWF